MMLKYDITYYWPVDHDPENCRRLLNKDTDAETNGQQKALLGNEKLR